MAVVSKYLHFFISLYIDPYVIPIDVLYFISQTSASMSSVWILESSVW
jgi:hypothetical protein